MVLRDKLIQTLYLIEKDIFSQEGNLKVVHHFMPKSENYIWCGGINKKCIKLQIFWMKCCL